MSTFRPLSETKFINDANLVSYWKLDGNSNDSKGSNNGTDTAMSYSAGKFSSAGDFNGSTSKVVFGSSIIPIGAKTISFWVKSSSTADQSLVTNARLGEPENFDHTRIAVTTGYFTYEIQYNGGTYVPLSSGVNVRDGVWHHCVGTYDGSVMRVYVDGALKGTSGSFTDSGTRARALQLGIDFSNFNKLNGSLDDIAIFSRALSASEVNELYQGMTYGEYLPVTTSPILLQDDFTGTTIDTSKWTETDPNGVISQNGVLNLTTNHSSTFNLLINKLESVASISGGTSVVQSNFTWTVDSTQEALPSVILWKDDNNNARITARDNVSGNTYRLIVTIGGSTVYNLDDGTTAAKGKDVKIVADATTIKFYYWSGSAWVQMGTTVTASLGYNRKFVLSTQDNTAWNGANLGIIDNAYFNNQDYTTQYPTSALGSTKLLLHLNGNSTDSSGNNNNGTDTAITYVDGKFGKCASFNGSSSKIEIGTLTGIAQTYTTPFTINSWIKLGSTGNYCIFDRYQGANPSGYFSFFIRVNNTNAGDIWFFIGSSQVTYNEIYTAGGILNTTEYKNVVATYDGTLMKLYVNGLLIGTTTRTVTPANTSIKSFSIGYNGEGNNIYYNGALDEVIIENYAWTPQQVAKYYSYAKGYYATL